MAQKLFVALAITCTLLISGLSADDGADTLTNTGSELGDLVFTGGALVTFDFGFAFIADSGPEPLGEVLWREKGKFGRTLLIDKDYDGIPDLFVADF